MSEAQLDQVNVQEQPSQVATKFCRFCGQKINLDAVMCVHCGRQVEELKTQQVAPQVVINNSNNNTNTNTNANPGMAYGVKPKNKWVALGLCLLGFFGFAGLHKFYEKKILLGILYLLTFGLIGIGTVVDAIILLFKPNPYF